MSTISIVLPSYNGEKYIRESIDSVREQTYKDWELIIVDDCSQDHTLEIVQEYETEDNRIHVIHNTVNRKLPASLNIGFMNAEGKYFTWTSDDNRFLPDALETMAEKLEISGSAMVCAAVYAIDAQGKIKRKEPLRYSDENIYRWNSIGSCFLYRREVWDKIGAYDTGLYCVEDYDYWLRIKESYGKIESIDRPLYQYRFHEASLTSTKKERILQALIQLRKKHLDCIVGSFGDSKDQLAAFYYEIMEKREMDREIKERIQSVLPELRKDRKGERGKYIIFGAGDYGRRALEELKGAVVFFADNNQDKTGKYIDGRKVLSFQEMVSLTGQYDIMIAIYRKNVYPLICQLLESGVERYCTWQTYQWEQL